PRRHPPCFPDDDPWPHHAGLETRAPPLYAWVRTLDHKTSVSADVHSLWIAEPPARGGGLSRLANHDHHLGPARCMAGIVDLEGRTVEALLIGDAAGFLEILDHQRSLSEDKN